MANEPDEQHRPGRLGLGVVAKRIVYSAIVCGVVLGIINFAAEVAERAGLVKLDTGDSEIVYLADQPYVPDGDSYVTNPRVRDTIVSSHFRRVKGNAWRMFVLGESFAMGTPYVHQSQVPPHAGGITSWLSADLQSLYPSHAIEIVNAAAGAQNSHRVRRIAEEVVKLQPDALLVAACNNEGVLPPGRVDEILHQTGGYRLLAKLTAPLVAPDQRSQFTPQDPDVDAIRAAFETNLRAIVAAAEQHDVPVLLCTMPVNLRYLGGGVGHLFQHERDEQYAEPSLSECTQGAIERFQKDDAAGAVALLRSCELDMEGLRILGLALFKLQQYDEARTLLGMYTELAPRNRCRPSLNRIIREVAKSSPSVHLVDLEAAAQAVSPGGIPGIELFVDSCHMNWAGYARMADVVLAAMHEHGIIPKEKAQTDRRPPRAQLAQQFGLPTLPPEFTASIPNYR